MFVSLMLLCMVGLWLKVRHPFHSSPEAFAAAFHQASAATAARLDRDKAVQATQQASTDADEQWLHDGNPPHVKAHSMREFRHMQFLNKDYMRWVDRNLVPLTYDQEKGMYAFRWNEIPDRIPAGQNEVVLLTQSSVSRLHSFKSMATEWGGPVSLSVFVPFTMGSPDATACRTRIRDFMYSHSKAPDAHPLVVSLLYTRAPLDKASCDIPPPPVIAPGKANKKAAAMFEARGRISGVLTRRLASTDVPEAHEEKPFTALYDAMYPVNALRNLAWSQIPSAGAFVFLLDVDFVPTPTLYAALKAGRWADTLRSMRSGFERRGRREALIVPAFERTRAPYGGDCGNEADCEFVQGNETPRSVARVRAMYGDKSVQIFHATKFEAGHSCYSGLHWLFEQKPGELVPFDYKHPCEPYAIGLSEAMPRYDERFRGRGMNKVEQLTHMAMWGFSWSVLPEHFVVHLPHASEGVSPEGGWDRIVVPLVLMKRKIAEAERESEFRRHIDMEIPSAT